MRWNLEEMCVHVDKIERRFQINETHIDNEPILPRVANLDGFFTET